MAEAQRQARLTLWLSLGFVAASLVATVAPGGHGWLALHLFLAGAAALAISGSTLLFTITWSAGPAPDRRITMAQRLAIAGGAVGVVAGRTLDLTSLLAVAGALHLAGLVTLGVLLVRVVRRAPERRFDASAAWYVAAAAAGVAGVGLGVAMGTGAADRWGGDPRAAHVVANLLGLVGLTLTGTLPTFAATQLRMRMSKRANSRRLAVLLAWQLVWLALAAGALLRGAGRGAGLALLAYACGLVWVVTLLPRPATKQLRWAGPRVAHLAAGWCWFSGGVVAAGLDAVTGDVVLGSTVVTVMVVCGLGQLLWGSMAYLLPVVRGGGAPALVQGFAATRSWPGVTAANALGVALLLGWEAVALVLGAVWLGDAAIRVSKLLRRADLAPSRSSAS